MQQFFVCRYICYMISNLIFFCEIIDFCFYRLGSELCCVSNAEKQCFRLHDWDVSLSTEHDSVPAGRAAHWYSGLFWRIVQSLCSPWKAQTQSAHACQTLLSVLWFCHHLILQYWSVIEDHPCCLPCASALWILMRINCRQMTGQMTCMHCIVVLRSLK